MRALEAAAWVAIGVVVALVVSLVRPVSAGAVVNSYVYWGINSSVNCSDWQHAGPPYSQYWISGFASCWHRDESATTDAYGNPASYSAIDHTKTSGGTAGALVELWYTGSSLSPHFRDLVNSTCTGLRVDTYKPDGTYMGDLHYLHIQVYGGVINTSIQYYNQTDGYWWRNLGTVKQTDTCWTTGPHLHQSGNVAGWTKIYSNGSVNPTNTWEHRVTR